MSATHQVTPASFAYFVLTVGRFVYASLIRLLIRKFVLSMSASKDVLALASLEVDLTSIEPGSTVTVKWHGKPVFIRHRTDADLKMANSVDVKSLRDPQDDAERVKDPRWLVVIGVCTHLGSIPLPNAGVFGGFFSPAMDLIMTSQVGGSKGTSTVQSGSSYLHFLGRQQVVDQIEV